MLIVPCRNAELNGLTCELEQAVRSSASESIATRRVSMSRRAARRGQDPKTTGRMRCVTRIFCCVGLRGSASDLRARPRICEPHTISM